MKCLHVELGLILKFSWKIISTFLKNNLQAKSTFSRVLVLITLGILTSHSSLQAQTGIKNNPASKESLLSKKNEGLDYLKGQGAIFQKTNNWDNLDAFLTGVTDYTKSTKNFKGSIQLLEELFEGNLENLDPNSKNRLLISLAWHCNQSNQPIRSLGYLGKITDNDLDGKQKNMLTYYKGQAYSALGNYDTALELFLTALPEFKKWNDPNFIGSISNDLGLLYNSLGDTTNAVNYLEQAIERAKEENNQDLLAQYLVNIGTVYKSMGAYQRALSAYNESIELAKSLGDSMRIAQNQMNAANVHIRLEQFGEANKNYLSSMAICKALGIEYGVYLNYINLIENATKWGKLDIAKAALDSAEVLSQKMDGKKEKVALLANKADLLTRLGKHEEATETLKASYELEKEMLNAQVQTKVNELTIRYETNLKEERLTAMNYELKKAQMKNTMYIIGLVSMLSLVGFWVYHKRSKKNAIKSLFKLNKESVTAYELNGTNTFVQDSESSAETKSSNYEQMESIYKQVCQQLIKLKNFKNPDIDLSYLSNLIGSNSQSIAQAIRIHTGKNFNSFIHSIRMAEAKKIILEMEGNNVLDINYLISKVGYSSKSTFNHAFQKETGMSPQEFKKLSDAEKQEKRKTENDNLSNIQPS
jgi:tetratricopeptide (TPR) repeat protein